MEEMYEGEMESLKIQEGFEKANEYREILKNIENRADQFGVWLYRLFSLFFMWLWVSLLMDWPHPHFGWTLLIGFGVYLVISFIVSLIFGIKINYYEDLYTEQREKARRLWKESIRNNPIV